MKTFQKWRESLDSPLLGNTSKKTMVMPNIEKPDIADLIRSAQEWVEEKKQKEGWTKEDFRQAFAKMIGMV